MWSNLYIFMPIRNYQNELMFRLDTKFIQKLFNKSLINFKNSTRAGRFLDIPPSSFRGYKNGYFSSMPEKLVKKLISLKVIQKNQFKRHIICSYYRDEQNNKILERGRQTRHKKLKRWKKEIPSLKEILNKDYLDFEKWFFAYQKLINFGARKVNYIKNKNVFLEVSYTTHSNNIKKEFILKFPKKIYIDDEFLYFFGLWVGDKAGGKRFGIMNKEQKIVSFTKNYLIKLYQMPESILYIGRGKDLPKNRNFNKIVKINNKQTGWAFSTHITNGILASFFYHLESNLNEFLYSIKKFNIFFAGLFDAEGNVFLEDSCFRWASKNSALIPIFREHLKRLDLFNRYDGCNLVAYNKKEFTNRILPYLIHPKKINNSNLVCLGKGRLEKRFIDILNTVKINPGITNKELAKVLKRKKSYAQIRFLEKLGYIYLKNYPKQIFIKNMK